MAALLTSPPGGCPPGKSGPPPELPRHPIPGFREAAREVEEIDRRIAKLGPLRTAARREQVRALHVQLRAVVMHALKLAEMASEGYPMPYAD